MLVRTIPPTARYLVMLTTLATLASSASAQCSSTFELSKQLNGDPNGYRFGSRVAVSGNIAVVGIPTHDQPGADTAGAAYIYTRASTSSPWVLEQSLSPADLIFNNQFGSAVAVDGTTVAIGAPGQGNDAVYVYTRSGTTWSLQQRIDGGLSAFHAFGASLSLSGDSLAIGDPLNSCCTGEYAHGIAYIYTRSAGVWTQQDEFLPTVRVPEGRFGTTVALSGNTLAVSQEDIIAPIDENTDPHGFPKVYVYTRSGSTWSPQQTVYPAGQYQFDSFGRSMALIGNTLLVGAPGNGFGVDPTDPGTAYVFTRSGSVWSQTVELQPAVPAADGDHFGTSVSLASEVNAIVGAPGYNGAHGRAFTFRLSGGVWQPIHALEHSTVSASAFGSAVAMSGLSNNATALVGSPVAEAQFGFQAGTATFFNTTLSTWTESSTVSEPLTAGNQLGYAVAVDGDWAVVGEPAADTDQGIDAGAAHVFHRVNGTWTHAQTLSNSALGTGDAFGYSVAISGDHIAVGAYADDTTAGADAGSVLTFYRDATDTWIYGGRVLASDAAAGDQYGWSVALRDNILLVGARADDNAAGANAGAAYLYTLDATNHFTSEVKILTQDLATGDELGNAVAIASPTRIYIAAYGEDTGGTNGGAVYVFDLQPIIGGAAWTQTRKITPSDGALGDNFGTSIAASGNTLVVGSPLDDNAFGVDAGAVYVYVSSGITNNTWTEQAKLLADVGATNDRFGWSVGLSGNELVIGALWDDNAGGTDAGSAYLFHRTGTGVWSLTQTFGASDRAAGDEFGTSVALSGDVIVVGAPSDDNEGGPDAGAAYFFRLDLNTPHITTQPASQVRCMTGTAVFTTAATGTGTVLYRWQHETSPNVWQTLVNGSVSGIGTVSGATTSTLTISNFGANAAGNYRASISDDCGVTLSNPALLTVACPADFNCSGAVTVQDIFDFLAAYFAGSPSADFNHSGATTVQDIFDFLAAYFAGCA